MRVAAAGAYSVTAHRSQMHPQCNYAITAEVRYYRVIHNSQAEIQGLQKWFQVSAVTQI